MRKGIWKDLEDFLNVSCSSVDRFLGLVAIGSQPIFFLTMEKIKNNGRQKNVRTNMFIGKIVKVKWENLNFVTKWWEYSIANCISSRFSQVLECSRFQKVNIWLQAICVHKAEFWLQSIFSSHPFLEFSMVGFIRIVARY